MKQRVLSGIRATGRLHLGNYLGAIKGMIELQNNTSYQTFYMVADGHAVTTPFLPADLGDNRREVIIEYLAAGLDPEKSVLFMQSMVPAHFELMFYLSAVTTVSRMQHLPTFKDKAAQYPENVTMALLGYPVLMAADILAYKASMVPVGTDQEPHLEVARDIARRMNADYALDFPEPQRFATSGEYVPSLLGQGKMSKTVEGSSIYLTDDLATIEKRLAGTPTDSGKGTITTREPVQTTQAATSKQSQRVYTDQAGKESPGVANLLQFVELIEGVGAREEYDQAYASTGIRYRDLKAQLAQAIATQLKPFQEKRAELIANAALVDTVIAEGAARASVVADATLQEVKKAIGLS